MKKKALVSLAIPNDLLIEILWRLPVKTLLRVRCVSKSWRSLIGDRINNRKKLPPAMIGLFHTYYQREFISLGSRTYIDPSSVDTAFSFIPSSQLSRISIVDCCNGLLLLQDRYSSPARLYICNPATRLWARIPKPASLHAVRLVLAFDTSRGSHFNILTLVHSNWPYSFSLFSSETGEWKEFQLTCTPADFERVVRDAVESDLTFCFFSGFVYVVIPKRLCVAAIDLERNLCTRIELAHELIPRFRNCYLRNRCIGQSVGLMHLAVLEDNLDLFVLVLKGGRFVLKH